MKTYYGVDSVQDARVVLPTLEVLWGVLPSVYARYVVGGYVTSADECAAILASGIRLVHVCNYGDAGTVGGAYADGVRDAANALAAMRATGCPARAGLLFRDIESAWAPSVPYLTGWCVSLTQAAQPGGFYCNAEWATFDAPYAALVPSVARRYRLVWTSEPENVGYVAPPGPAWNPATPPSDPSAVVGWQFVEQPAEAPNVDINLWTEEAYGLAWGSGQIALPPPAPPTFRTKDRVALKAAANHGPDLAIDPSGRPVMLELGAVVVPVSSVTTAGELWRGVTIPGTKIHGYLLARDIVVDAV